MSLVYKDKATPTPFIEALPKDDGSSELQAKPDHVYLDCMGFGMGCSCLQVCEYENEDDFKYFRRSHFKAVILTSLAISTTSCQSYAQLWLIT